MSANPAIALLLATGIWWLSTGLVLVMVHWSIRKRLTSWQLLAIASAVWVSGVLLLFYGSTRQTPLGSYAGFLGALLVWAWHETTFLTGIVTGRNKGTCPPGLTGFARFVSAWKAVCDHEIALLVTGVFLWVALSDAPNTFGLATFGLLWGMRISVKLLIFLGARYAISGLMPPRIAYLKTYFNTVKTTRFFPVMLAIALGMFIVLVMGAMDARSDYAVVGHMLLAAFMALAIIEHLILVLPISDTALWRWALPKAQEQDRTQLELASVGAGAPQKVDPR